MSHCHLSLDLADSLENDTDNDNYGRTAECESREVTAGEHVDEQRENGDNGKEYRTDKGDS